MFKTTMVSSLCVLACALQSAFAQQEFMVSTESAYNSPLRGANPVSRETGEPGSLTFVDVAGSGMDIESNESSLEADSLMPAELVQFFAIMEDDELYAKWEKEEVPQLLLEIEATKRRGSKKQKKWSRDALVKSEIDTCYPKNYWKDTAYGARCTRKTRVWFATVCTGWGCDSGDNLIWPLCHHGCDGWKDDGTRCFKPCSDQSTTPTQCGHAMCAADTSACVNGVVNMIVSIAQMLSNICPAGTAVAAGRQIYKAAGRAAKMAALKAFAKGLAKTIARKVKRKAKKFMKKELKNQVEYLKEEFADFLLEEAAEAMAIEYVAKESRHEFPDAEEIARAVDPIGVFDVIDAFNLNSCTDTELATFPGCSPGREIFSWSMSYVLDRAEEECCFGYGDITKKTILYFGWWSYTGYTIKCLAEDMYYDIFAQQEGDEIDVDPLSFDDDDFYKNLSTDEETDIISSDDEYGLDDYAIQFCVEICEPHGACLDNDIPGANLTMFDACTSTGCCLGPDDEFHPDTTTSFLDNFVMVTEPADEDCNECTSMNMCADEMKDLMPAAHDYCVSSNCCPPGTEITSPKTPLDSTGFEIAEE